MSGPRRAFLLIELMIVTAISGVLMSPALPAIQQAREASRAAAAGTTSSEIGQRSTTTRPHGRFPPGSIPSGAGSWSVHGRLLPVSGSGERL